MPTTEYQITLDRREIASIIAALRLLEWAAGAGKALPYAMCRMIDEISSGGDGLEPLTDAELRELARRLS